MKKIMAWNCQGGDHVIDHATLARISSHWNLMK
jgi:hypothetical protein